MTITIPPLTLVSARLRKLNDAQMRQLSDESGVPFGTLIKIRNGHTLNPGIETVRKFFYLIPGEERRPAEVQG